MVAENRSDVGHLTDGLGVGLAHLESHHAGDVVLVRCLLRNGVKELRSRLGVEARPSGASRFSAGKRAVDLGGVAWAIRPHGCKVDGLMTSRTF